MKFLKGIVVLILVLLIAAVIAYFVLPNNYEITRSKTINAPVETVYNQVASFKNWEAWSPWQKEDPEMKTTYSGAESGVGAKSEFISGNGKMSGTHVHTAVVENKSISSDLAFKFGKSAEMPADKITWTFEKIDENTTKVDWNFKWKMHGLMKLGGPYFKSLNIRNFENGLNDLAEVSAKAPMPQPKLNSVLKNYDEQTLEPQSVLFVKRDIPLDKVGEVMSEWYPKLQEYASKNGEIIGAPYSEYLGEDEQLIYLRLGLPVKEAIKETVDMKMGELPGGKFATVSNFGPYEFTGEAHAKFQKYLEDNDYEVDEKRSYGWEVYASDPATVGPYDLETKIYYPVK